MWCAHSISQSCFRKISRDWAEIDRECHPELPFGLLTDSWVQRAAAPTQLPFSGRWTERWLDRQVQSHPAQWSQTFLCGLVFLFATNSYFLLSSYSNKAIICSNDKWKNGDGHFWDIWLLRINVRKHIHRKIPGLHRCPSHVGRTQPWHINRLLAANYFFYNFLLFAAETRDTFYWQPDCLTSVFWPCVVWKLLLLSWG